MRRFEDLLRRVDEALVAAGAGRRSRQDRRLAGKRGELERALTAAEEVWLEVSVQIEAAGGKGPGRRRASSRPRPGAPRNSAPRSGRRPQVQIGYVFFTIIMNLAMS